MGKAACVEMPDPNASALLPSLRILRVSFAPNPSSPFSTAAATAVLSPPRAALKSVKRFEEALASFDEAISTHADFYPSYRGKTDLLSALDRHEEAAAAASAAAALRPDEAGPIADRAFAFLKLKRYEEALGDFNTAVKMGDASRETARLRAVTLSQLAVEKDKAGDMAAAET